MFRPEDIPRRGAASVTVIDNPIIPYPPSDEINKLKQAVKDLTKPEPFQLGSPYHPINFITSLLLQMAANTDSKRFEHEQLELDKSLNPTGILQDVRIFTPESFPDREVTVVQDVLLNKAFKGIAGLVLTGNYSGIVLQPTDSSEMRDGMIVRRLFRDEKAIDYPHLPDPHSARLLSSNPQLIEEFEQNYNNFMNFAISEVKKDLWLSDIFKLLCTIAEIPISENFHTTRFPEMI